MKIKTQVSISLIVFALLAVVIIFSAYTSFNQLQEIQKKQQIIDSIEQSSFDLYYLENDYFIHGGTIPFELWNAKYAALSGQLQALTLTDLPQKAVLNQMFDSQKELNKSFSDLVAVTSGGQGTEPGGVSQELKEFSASTLEGQTQMLMSRSSELSQLVKAEAHAIEQRTILIISLSIAVLMLFVLLNYLVINRSVLRSISALQNGTERIGSGDLDTKIETISNDELGHLSQTFNEMTSSLANSRNLLLATNIDLEEEITERKRAEDALRKSEEKYRTYIENSPVGIFILDSMGRYRDVNASACSMLGYSREELFSLSMRDLVPANSLTKSLSNLKKLQEDGFLATESALLKKNGDTLPVTMNAVRLLDGTFLGFCSDLTERKLTEDTLQRVNQKLNVLSQLTRNDLTNQIFVLSSYLELAKNQLAGQDHIIETVQKGVRVIQSIHETIQYSKDFQDMGVKPPNWQNLKMALLMGLSHISIGKIQHSLETENLEIFVDPLLEKVCQRLFENSVKHGEHVTRIRVWHTATPDGVTFFFEDDGIGIPHERKEQIFLRSESTHATKRSLTFVREILDITGITIKETGEPGKGARFEMTVPKGTWRLQS